MYISLHDTGSGCRPQSVVKCFCDESDGVTAQPTGHVTERTAQSQPKGIQTYQVSFNYICLF